jgi:adenylate cyclase
MSGCPSNGEASSDLFRRLAAVVFVDIVGYTILMASEETRTHRDWMAVLDEVIRPQIRQHRGAIVKSTGDGVLAEFSSTHDAVKWAREVQRLVTAAPAGSDRPSAIVLRMAIHLGDIITTNADVFGDCVNIAARLQEFAPAGGILLSEAVYDCVRGSLGNEARDIGFLELKNFARPVRAYALDPDVKDIAVPVRPKEGKLPSIAIMPLQNVGGDPADEYFCDGCMEDVALSLAGLRELTVISRGSTLAYSRGQRIDPREVGRLLGVRYVVLGSMRRSEGQVRVSVELCDTNSGASLWAEKAQVALGELFDVQDRIVQRIVTGIAPNLRAAELRNAMRKMPESFTAYDCALRGLYIINALDRNSFPQAREFFSKAMAEDPSFAMPVAWSARWHNLYVGQGWSPDPQHDRKKAVELAAKAIDLDGQNALALATYGHLRSYLFHECDSALTYFDRAFSACPNHALAWMLSVGTLSYLGRGEQAVKHAEHALRLSPLDMTLFQFYGALALAHYVNGSYEEAVRWGRMSASENSYYTSNMRYLAAALAAHGKLDEARTIAKRLIQHEPDFRLSGYRQTRQPFRDTTIGARYLEHLKVAGLPE